jgi:hypothetical protein
LSEVQLREAGTCRALLDSFAQFVKPTDIVAGWGTYSLNLFAKAGGVLGEKLDVRAVGQRLMNKKLGALEVAAAAVGEPSEPLAQGRAGARLAALAQIVTHWRSTFA